MTISRTETALTCNNHTEADIERLFVSAFGMSSEEFEKELEAEFEKASPEEQAEFEKIVAEANAILPSIHTTVDRIGLKLADTSAALSEVRKSLFTLDVRMGDLEADLDAMAATSDFPSATDDQ